MDAKERAKKLFEHLRMELRRDNDKWDADDIASAYEREITTALLEAEKAARLEGERVVLERAAHEAGNYLRYRWALTLPGDRLYDALELLMSEVPARIRALLPPPDPAQGQEG
jgi:hypothetical protein